MVRILSVTDMRKTFDYNSRNEPYHVSACYCIFLFLSMPLCSAPAEGRGKLLRNLYREQRLGYDCQPGAGLGGKIPGEHPEVRISVTGGGSGTGIASLINKTVDIANASRKSREEEIAEAESNGVEPVEHIIARDAIAVIVIQKTRSAN